MKHPLPPAKKAFATFAATNESMGYTRIRVIEEMHVQIDDVIFIFDLMAFWLR